MLRTGCEGTPSLTFARRIERLLDWPIGWCSAAFFCAMRRLGPRRASALCAAVLRRLGPLLPVHRLARAQLAATFPERDAAWYARTLRGAWDNLGRVAGEYVHLGALEVEIGDDARAVLARFAAETRPRVIASAHLGNFEMAGVLATRYGRDVALLYRMPNNRVVAAQIAALRAPVMGRLIHSRAKAAHELQRHIAAGGDLAMLVDQHWSRGVVIDFLGRPCRANPTAARLARHFDCAIYCGAIIRDPGTSRFRLDLAGPIDQPRDAEGQVDVAALTQRINDVIGAWVRAHPEQWLWFHRRWRP